jgi:hypothetical protein
MAAKQVNPRVIVLAGLVVVAAVILMATWPRGTADIPVSAPDPSRDGAAQVDPAVPPPLGLEGIGAERAIPANRRDLFRFGSAQPDPGPAAPDDTPATRPGGGRTVGPPPEPAGPVVDPGPPQPAPIPLRYVMYAASPQTGKTAGLSDGRFVYHGREGEIVDGKWRIVKIGVESVVIERVDGTGRQTLRLAGGG